VNTNDREGFEAKFPKAHWVEWDDKQGRYICAYVADAEANSYNKMFKAWIEAKAQAVLEKQSLTLTCAELKEAFDFGAPDGEKDQFQMETEMTITWLKDGYEGEGYYCWYADLPEEGCIKLGKSESGVEE
jgi:hypothetical protein